MFEGSRGRTNGSIRISSSYNNKLNEKVSRLSSARSTSLVAYGPWLQYVGVGYTVPRRMATRISSLARRGGERAWNDIV